MAPSPKVYNPCQTPCSTCWQLLGFTSSASPWHSCTISCSPPIRLYDAFLGSHMAPPTIDCEMGLLIAACCHFFMHPRIAAKLCCCVLVFSSAVRCAGALMEPVHMCCTQGDISASSLLEAPCPPRVRVGVAHFFVLGCTGTITGGNWHLSHRERSITCLLVNAIFLFTLRHSALLLPLSHRRYLHKAVPPTMDLAPRLTSTWPVGSVRVSYLCAAPHIAAVLREGL